MNFNSMKFDFERQPGKRIIIKGKRKSKFIDISDVVFLQRDGCYTIFNLVNEDKVAVSKQLKHFEEELERLGFLKANYNTLINARYIGSLFSNHYRRVIKIQNKEIKISRRRNYLFKKTLKGIKEIGAKLIEKTNIAL